MKDWQETWMPIQPYFTLDTSCFKQEVYLRHGICSFYSFQIEEDMDILVVPDGCIDIVFEYRAGEMQALACGNPLRPAMQHWEKGVEVFGVRFVPGTMPAGCNIFPKELVDKKVPLEQIMTEKTLIDRMAKQRDFRKRMQVFLDCYRKQEEHMISTYGKRELCMAVRDLICGSGGTIKIAEIADITGYTARYVNKVFADYMGLSPKMFCKIMQFQRALHVLSSGHVENMTDTAVKLGYYDQPQFIRDFKTYLGITPSKYLVLLEKR